MPVIYPPTNISFRFLSAQYDGTNGAYIVSCISGATLLTEGDGTLVFAYNDYNVFVYTTNWVVFLNAQLFQVMSNAEYYEYWVEYPLLAQVTALENATSVTSLGNASVPTLLSNTQTTVSVNMSPALANVNYNVASVIIGSADLLTDLQILSTTIVDVDTVDVVVRNNGLLSLSGATVLVNAIHK